MADEIINDSVVIASTDEIILSLKRGKKLHDHFADQFRKSYKISGKLMCNWQEYFKIEIPPDINPEICKMIAIKIMELHQEASFFKAEAEARLTAYKGVSADKYRVEMATLITEFKHSGQKMPAATTLTTLAENAVSGQKNAMIHVEIELNFWKEVLADLANARKLIENATINLGIEAKALQQDKYLDKLNSTKNY
jgi:hypothetical protein